MPIKPSIPQGVAWLATWVIFAVPTTQAEEMSTITRKEQRSSFQGSEQYFTGSVQVDMLFGETEQSHLSGAVVTFEPGARSAWHRHPLGQRLIVTASKGWTQTEGGPVQELLPGDVLWCPPGVKHWHGASPQSSLSHIALTESLEGKIVEWLEKVSDEEYRMTNTTPPTDLNVTQPNIQARGIAPAEVQSVTPALERYTQEFLYADVWNRPGLSKRDRSLVTIALMIARDQTEGLSYYLNQALENGVNPGELSETITHLAYYAGWESAFGAVRAAKEVFAQRHIKPEQLPPAFDRLLPIDEAAEKQRASSVEQNFGVVAPGVVHYTTEALFQELWRRPGLAPRDRSLITVSALIGSGQTAQITYHLNRAMDSGLTQEQASEMLTQLAFYAGWPKIFSALPVVKDVFEKRAAVTVPK